MNGLTNLNVRTDCEESWLTPPYILSSLGDFDLDPCFLPEDIRPWNTAKKHYWKEIDGLSKLWYGRVWLNPPYGQKTFKWIEKLSCHGNGIALIFARTETRGFHDFIWDRADAIFFFKGRIKFFGISSKEAKYVAPAPSCLIAYGQNNVEALQKSNLRGKLILLDNSQKYDKINLFFE
jgi:hypothetical protein